jgi:hypothetical protein
MRQKETGAATFQVHGGLLITGAVLAGVGSLLGLAGLAISGAALADATRRWVRALETPPSTPRAPGEALPVTARR